MHSLEWVRLLLPPAASRPMHLHPASWQLLIGTLACLRGGLAWPDLRRLPLLEPHVFFGASALLFSYMAYVWQRNAQSPKLKAA